MKLELLVVKHNYMLSICALNIDGLNQKRITIQKPEAVLISTGEWFAHSIC